MSINKIATRLKNFAKRIKANFCYNYMASMKKPILEDTILLESGQGGNINGNMFALLRELKTNDHYKDWETVFVITGGNREKAAARMKFYGFDNVVLVDRLSRKYNHYLARSKYLATDNSFPPYFHKRESQVYLNTWHGTPLKTLGKSDKSNFLSLANIQKNYLMSDYALFPNEFTKNVFWDDYSLRHLFKQDVIMVNYPRNEVFYDLSGNDTLREKLDLKEKQIFTYMPTWRGSQREADVAQQLHITEKYLREIDNCLSDDQVFYVNLHFLVSNSIDYNSYHHIYPFPAEYETYDFLKLSDVLVTDYSSVFFDFAPTGKKIVLFAYDKEDYLSSRGLYISLDSLPFPVAETVEQLMEELNSPGQPDRSAFLKEYCPYGSANISRQVLSLMETGTSDALVYETNPETKSDFHLLYGDRMAPQTNAKILDYINSHPDKTHLFVYRGNLDFEKKQFLDALPANVILFGTVTSIQFTVKETFSVFLRYVFKRLQSKDPKLKPIASREQQRIYPTVTPEKVVDFASRNPFVKGVLQAFSCDYEASFVPMENDYSAKQLFPIIYNSHKSMGKMTVFSRVTLRSHRGFALENVTVEIDGKSCKPDFFLANTSRVSKKHSCLWKFSIYGEDLGTMGKNNLVMVDFGFSEIPEGSVKRAITYNRIFRSFNFASKGPVFMEKTQGLTACFRQGPKNKLTLLVRNTNSTDPMREQVKLFFAFLASRFMRKSKIIFLFEKEGSRFEESASVLYQELIDQGYDNAYFLLTRDYPYLDEIEEKYKNNIVYKGSFKHYLYFFASRNFIGSETMAHALDISVLNRIALQKIFTTKCNNVFLQHGVMYMVSLDSPSRTFFNPKQQKKPYKYRVVVSSRAEANHFIVQGRHKESHLYISGLPKFDKNKWNPAADKIAIMPTWRPWEANQVQVDPTNSNYYKMMMRIADSIPEEYQDKIVLLPHPLFQERINRSGNPVKERFRFNEKYDTILQDTALLITDYSSIAYDAFYRGAQVIFYWEEKDRCMESYGTGTKLMLTEDNVFAPVAYNAEQLKEAFEAVYKKPHSENQEEKYQEIVAFHDGNNAKRLISMLKKDGII